MINKKTFLAASVVLALTACGSSESGSGESSTKLTAIDGYLTNAELWIDTNDNLELDAGDTQLADNSDENGQFTLTAEQQGHAVFIKAISGQTIDSVRGVVSEDFELSAPAGSKVANPMTNMVVQQLAENPEITQTEAEDTVIKSIQDSGLTASRDLIFGDYLANTSDQQAQALNIIGESLVDNSDLSIESQLKIASAVSVEVQKVVADETGDLSNFYPSVSVNNEGSVEVEVNSRPLVTGSIETQTLSFENVLTDINVTTFFSDADEDTLTYQLVLKDSDQLNGLTITPTTGIISGTPTLAGTFEYQVFAKDDKTRSYPLNFTVIVETANTAPTVNQEIATQLQATISAWQLTVGETVDYTLDISALFTDAESDTLDYRVDTTLRVAGFVNGTLSVSENDGTITLSGTPSNNQDADTSNIYVYASDNINEETLSIFTLPEIIGSSTPSEITNPLAGKTWYAIEQGASDGSDNFDDASSFDRVWCDTYKFENNKVYINTRTIDNLTQCSDTATDEIGSYTIDENQDLIATITFEENSISYTNAVTLSMKATEGNIDNASLILSTLANSEFGDIDELSTYYSKKADAMHNITLKSDDAGTVRDTKTYLPSNTSNVWKVGNTTVSLTQEDEYLFDADIILELPDEDFTCDMVRDSFDNIAITGSDIGYIYSGGSYDSTIECYDITGENDSFSYAIVDIDISEPLTTGNIYSIIGYAKESEGSYIQSIKFNIEWTGTGNNE